MVTFCQILDYATLSPIADASKVKLEIFARAKDASNPRRLRKFTLEATVVVVCIALLFCVCPSAEERERRRHTF